MLLTGVGFAIVSVILLIELVRRRKIKERLALYWGIFPVLVLFFAINPFVTSSLAHFFGFSLASNFLLVCLSLSLLLLNLYLSATIGNLENRINILAEEIAFINSKID